MTERQRQIEMTIDGDFISPPKPPLLTRILIGAVVIAVVAAALSLAAFALWLALAILPIAVGAAIVAWGVWRFQAWRAGG